MRGTSNGGESQLSKGSLLSTPARIHLSRICMMTYPSLIGLLAQSSVAAIMYRDASALKPSVVYGEAGGARKMESQKLLCR